MSAITTQKTYVTYEQFGALADELVRKLQGQQFTKVYGPPRGGLPLAVHLAHHLDLTLVTSESFLSNMNKWRVSDRLLVVDDILRRGKTMKGISELLAIREINHLTAVLYYQQQAIFTPDIFLRTTDSWVVFPWEHRHDQS